MADKRIFSEFKLGSMTVIYIRDADENVGFTVIPSDLRHQFELNLQTKVQSLIQTKLRVDDYDKNFSNGSSMFRSGTTQSLKLVRQTNDQHDATEIVMTELMDHWGNRYRHYVQHTQQTNYLKTWSTFQNLTAETEALQLLSSICLSNLSWSSHDNRVGELSLIRFRSKWSLEGRPEVHPIEEYELEPSWKPSGLAVEKFGQLGSMPVRRFFPVVGVSNPDLDLTTIIQLDALGSWQIEALKLDADLILTGGLPDEDYGRWVKLVRPGAIIESIGATITVGHGTLAKVSAQLMHQPATTELPVVFNEWATSWGQPSVAAVKETVAVLKQHAVGTYVIDAGWFAKQDGSWQTSHGDWVVSKQLFPNGLAEATQVIHEAGMKAGIWFELETVGNQSAVFNQLEHLITRNGIPVTSGTRRFWDLRQEWVQKYLHSKVTDTLRDAKFDYLKIDYNDSIGIGADSDEDFGTGLQDSLEGTIKFIKSLKRELPQLVIENCASGGHRLTRPFINLTDFSSFSDAHESSCIPLIAANELNLVPATKNLIWAVLHPKQTDEEITYKVLSAFLGRVCLSGDVLNLNDTQWKLVDDMLDVYRLVAPIIVKGTPFVQRANILSYAQPDGWQIAGFSDQHQAMVLATTFGRPEMPSQLITQLDGDWQCVAEFGSDNLTLDIGNGVSVRGGDREFTAHVWLLNRK